MCGNKIKLESFINMPITRFGSPFTFTQLEKQFSACTIHYSSIARPMHRLNRLQKEAKLTGRRRNALK